MAQELKAYNVVATADVNPEVVDSLGCTEFAAYDADEVDAVLAEKDKDIAYWRKEYDEETKLTDALKAEIESLKASHYAEIRRLRRLLWHAIALFCARSCEYFNGIMSHCLMGQDDLYKRCEEKKNKYLHAMYKCRAKAEEYK